MREGHFRHIWNFNFETVKAKKYIISVLITSSMQKFRKNFAFNGKITNTSTRFIDFHRH